MQVSDIYSEIAFGQVVWFLKIIGVLSLLLLTQVLIMRGVLVFRKRRERRFRQKWQDLFMRSMVEERLVIPRVRRLDRKVFLLLWNRYQESLKGASAVALRRVVDSQHCERYFRRSLVRGNLRERLLITVTVGNLRDDQYWDEVLDNLYHWNGLVSLSSARALVQMNVQNALPLILALLPKRSDWSRVKVASIFKEAGIAPLSDAISAIVQKSTWHAVIPFIPFFHMVNMTVTSPIVEQVLDSDVDDRLISLCLKVIENPLHRPLVKRFLSHPRWHIRMHAAIALGKIGLPEDILSLKPLLHDPEWWVRYRAAQALLALPQVTLDTLVEIISEEEDKYALDVLQHVLSEAGAS